DALYIGGTFDTAGGVSAARLARWNGTSWSGLGNGVTMSSGSLGAVSQLASVGTDVYVAGIFEKAGDKPQANFAHWNDQKNFNPMQMQLSRPGLLLPDRMELTVSADQSERFVIECSEDFRSWTSVQTNSTVPFTFIDSNRSVNVKRFYRVRQD